MNIKVEPGKYVAAVSGGVDSMVLLNLMARQPRVKLTVAHFDHGIRDNSKDDRLFVQEAAKQLKLPFIYSEGKLGKAASEAKARQARYKFLQSVRKSAGANAVATAHHQNDAIETALINLLRGSGRKGLSPLKNQDYIIRPMLSWPKHIIINYACTKNIPWREDPTNQDTKYLRNHVRHNILANLNTSQKLELIKHLEKLGVLNDEIDAALVNQLHLQPAAKELDRQWFIMLPHQQAVELMAMWLRCHDIASFDTKLLEKLVTNAKTLKTGKKFDVNKAHQIKIEKTNLALTRRN